MKLFVAFPLTSDLRDAVVELQKRFLERIGPAAPSLLRPVAIEKLHMTLIFLGETDSSHLRRIEDAITTAADSIFHTSGRRDTAEPAGTARLNPTKVGAFPSVKRPSVIWVGIDDVEGVATSFVSVARRQLRETTPIAIDDRRFVPHITIAYVRRRLDREGRGVLRRVLVEETPSLQSARTGPYRVERAVLYESVPTPNGTRYDERFQVAL